MHAKSRSVNDGHSRTRLCPWCPGADASALSWDFNYFLNYSVLQSHNNLPSCFAETSKRPKQQSRNISRGWRRRKMYQRLFISLVKEQEHQTRLLHPKERHRLLSLMLFSFIWHKSLTLISKMRRAAKGRQAISIAEAKNKTPEARTLSLCMYKICRICIKYKHA